MIATEYVLLGASVLLLLSILASKASGRLGVPALLLFLVIGMLAGSDGPGGIYFDDARLSQSLGVVALALILFAGGLDTDWNSIRPVFREGLALSTLGVLFTALLVGGFVTWVLPFSLLEGLLLGAIVSSTDAAAVFAVLRSRNVSLKGSLEPLLELESGSNDPMAVFLTIGLIRLLANPKASAAGLIPLFVLQMALGAALGYGIGKMTVHFVNRLRLEYEGLYPVLTLSLVVFTYGAATSLGGNGFLAVYLAGLVMGNSDFIHKRSLIRFHDGLAWLMQITMFLTLGLLVFPSRLIPIAGSGLLIAAFLMLIARPIGVFVSLAFTKRSLREKVMVSWVGLRGAAPIILATFPYLAGISKADTVFHLVFFIVLTSVLIQGTSIPLVARWLGVDAPATDRRQHPLEFVPAGSSRHDLVEIKIPPGSAAAGKQIVELGLPIGALAVLINRSGDYIVPSGGTVLAEGDTVLVLADKESLARARSILQSPPPVTM
jgi:cell volume regulation protein A